MKNDIAGIKINWTYVPELVEKASKALKDVEEKLKKVEEQRKRFRKQKRELMKFIRGPVAKAAANNPSPPPAN